MITGTGAWPARVTKVPERVIPGRKGEIRGCRPAWPGRAEHPQRLGLGGLGRLEEEAAGSGGERPEQVGLPLAAAAADDAQGRLRAVIGDKVGQAPPLAVPAEDPDRLGQGIHRDLRESKLQVTELYLSELCFSIC